MKFVLKKLQKQNGFYKSLFNQWLHYFRKQRRITSFDIGIFFRQFATLLTAGIPIVQSCHILEKCQEKIAMRLLIYAIRREILTGKNLFHCLQNKPHYFDELICQLTYIGEQTGKLDAMLITIANYQEKNIALRNKMKQVLFYPCMIIVIAILITLSMLLFVIPHFAELFHDMQNKLPFLTLMIFYISAKLKQWIEFIPLFIFPLIYFVYRRKQLNIFYSHLKQVIVKLPFIKQVLHKMMLSRFTRNLAITFAAGLSITESLKLAAGSCGNTAFKRLIAQLHGKISSGLPLHHAMEALAFPPLMIQMIKIGEESGTLSHMLNKTADFFESDIDHLINRLNLLLEPLIMVVLGVLIGGLVIGMYLPIFKLGNVL